MVTYAYAPKGTYFPAVHPAPSLGLPRARSREPRALGPRWGTLASPQTPRGVITSIRYLYIRRLIGQAPCKLRDSWKAEKLMIPPNARLP